MASYVARMADEIEALAVYGTLAPGEKNHWVLSRIGGEWCTGTVRGYTFEITWGAAEGYEGFVADESGGLVQVAVLRSSQLPIGGVRSTISKERATNVARWRSRSAAVPSWPLRSTSL